MSISIRMSRSTQEDYIISYKIRFTPGYNLAAFQHALPPMNIGRVFCSIHAFTFASLSFCLTHGQFLLFSYLNSNETKSPHDGPTLQSHGNGIGGLKFHTCS